MIVINLGKWEGRFGCIFFGFLKPKARPFGSQYCVRWFREVPQSNSRWGLGWVTLKPLFYSFESIFYRLGLFRPKTLNGSNSAPWNYQKLPSTDEFSNDLTTLFKPLTLAIGVRGLLPEFRIELLWLGCYVKVNGGLMEIVD